MKKRKRLPTRKNDVGYGRPPKHTQFKPGQSGNPKGRPKGSKNLKTDLIEELQQTIDVRIGGKAKKVSKQRAMIMNLLNRALSGDARAQTTLVNLLLRVLDPDERPPEKEPPLNKEEQDVIDLIVQRFGPSANDIGKSVTNRVKKKKRSPTKRPTGRRARLPASKRKSKSKPRRNNHAE